MLQVFGQQNLLILKHPEFKGAVGPLSKYVCPPTAYEKDSSEHRAPRATQLHQVRQVPVAQQLLIWENDLSELCRALHSEIRVTTTAFCRKVQEVGFGFLFSADVDGAGLIPETPGLGRNGI